MRQPYSYLPCSCSSLPLRRAEPMPTQAQTPAERRGRALTAEGQEQTSRSQALVGGPAANTYAHQCGVVGPSLIGTQILFILSEFQ